MTRTIARVCVLGVALAAARGRADFSIGPNFTGASQASTFDLNSIGFTNAEPSGAIGPGAFVEFTDASYSVYDPATGAAKVPTTSLLQFWQSAGVTGLSDAPGGVRVLPTQARVLFDPASQRWFAVAIDRQISVGNPAENRILVAVSRTSDPTAGWNGFALPSGVATPAPPLLKLGIDRAGLYVTAINTVSVIPKADLLAGGGSVAHVVALNAPGGPSLTPVVDPQGAGLPHALLSSQDFLVTDLTTNPPVGRTVTGVVVSQIVGTLAHPTITNPSIDSILGHDVSTPDGTVSGAQQPGTSVRLAADDVPWLANVVAAGGYLWAVNPALVDGRDAIHWYRLDASTGFLLEQGFLGDPGHDYFTASIAANAAGDVVIGYDRSGPTEFASAYASVGLFDGTSTTFAAPTLLKAGVAAMTFDSLANWSFVSQTSVDPNDPKTFWTIQSYVAGQDSWSTQITAIHIAAVPEPTALALLSVAVVATGARTLARTMAGRVLRTPPAAPPSA